LLRQRYGDIGDLIIAGRLGWLYDDTVDLPAKLGLAENVRFLQYVTEDMLAALYRDAIALVYPSLYEGFGLPVIEAMQANTPVVTSAMGALAELGEDSLWRADPGNYESIADAMAQVMVGGDLAQQRVRDAAHWASQCTWDRAAEQTRLVYQQVAAIGG